MTTDNTTLPARLSPVLGVARGILADSKKEMHINNFKMA